MGEGVPSMLEFDLVDDDESYRNSGGDPTDEIELLRPNCGSRARLGLSSRGDKFSEEVSDEIDGNRIGDGVAEDCFVLCTNDSQSLLFRIEKTRSRVL